MAFASLRKSVSIPVAGQCARSTPAGVLDSLLAEDAVVVALHSVLFQRPDGADESIDIAPSDKTFGR